MGYKVKDIQLAKKGRNLIHWAEEHMPVMMNIRKDFEKKNPLDGTIISCCLHVTKETAVLAETLKAGGAKNKYFFARRITRAIHALALRVISKRH